MRYEDTFICYQLINAIDKIAYVDYYGYNICGNDNKYILINNDNDLFQQNENYY